MAELGFLVTREIATEVIQEGIFLPWVDHAAFQIECARRQIALEKSLAHCGRDIVFDRGIHCLAAYRRVQGLDVVVDTQYGGYDICFVFEPVPLWDNDGIRYEDPSFTREINPYVADEYRVNGVQTVIVPFMTTPMQRVEFILNHLRAARRGFRMPARSSLHVPAHCGLHVPVRQPLQLQAA